MSVMFRYFLVYLYSTLMSVTFVAGCLGNVLVILVVLRYSCMQTVTNIYLLSLSLADILFLLSIPLLLHQILANNFPASQLLCSFYISVTLFNWFLSTFSLTAMAADRFLAIVHPIPAQRIRQKKYTVLIIVCLWLFSCALMSPGTINASLQPLNLSSTSTALVYNCNQSWNGGHRAYIMYTFCLSYLLPCLFIMLFYTCVIYTLSRLKAGKSSRNKRQKTTKMVTIVILAYIFCWLPYWINQLNLVSWPSRHNETNYNNTAIVPNRAPSNHFYMLYLNLFYQFLGYLNSALNPLLYSYMSVNFRTAFRKMILRSQASFLITKKTSLPNPAPTGGLSLQTHVLRKVTGTSNNLDLHLEDDNNHPQNRPPNCLHQVSCPALIQTHSQIVPPSCNIPLITTAIIEANIDNEL